MSAAIENNLEIANNSFSSPKYQEHKILNEEPIENLTAAIKVSENIEEFYEHLNNGKPSKRETTERDETNTEMNSPTRPRNYSETKSQKSAYLSRVWDPMQCVNSSDEEECVFKPKINSNASRLSKRTTIGDGDTNENLYKDAFTRRAKQQEYQDVEVYNIKQRAASPKIEPKSMKLVLNRLQKAMKNLVSGAEETGNEGRLSFEGLGTVLYRLGLFQNLEFMPKDGQGDRSSLSINQKNIKPARLSKEIFFHESLWKICKLASLKDDSIPSDLVYKLLMVLVEERCATLDSSFFLKEMMEEALEKIDLKSKDEKESMFETLRKEKNLWTLEKIVAEFRRLFDDKTAFMSIYQSCNVISSRNTLDLDNNYQHTHTPQVNKKSAKLDAKFFVKNIKKVVSQDTDVENPEWKNRNKRLYKYSKHLNEKKALYLEARIEEELAPCTFTPKVNDYKGSNRLGRSPQNLNSSMKSSVSPGRTSYFAQAIEENPKTRHLGLYEVAKVYKEQLLQKAYHQKKQEEITEMADCSFKPKLNRNYEFSPQRDQDFYTNIPRGFKKVVERLHRGESERISRKEELERIPRGENYEKNKNAPSNPPTFLEREKIKKQEVLVYVDVSIGPGRTGRIGIHKGDNAKDLAKHFARTYSLNVTMKESLEKLLQSYISTYFSKPVSQVHEEHEHAEDEDYEERAEQEQEELEEDEEEEEYAQEDAEYNAYNYPNHYQYQ